MKDDPALREAQKAMAPREPFWPFRRMREFSDRTVRFGGALLVLVGGFLIYLLFQRAPDTVNPAPVPGRGGILVVPILTLYGAYLLVFGKRRELGVGGWISMCAVSFAFILWYYFR